MFPEDDRDYTDQSPMGPEEQGGEWEMEDPDGLFDLDEPIDYIPVEG